MLGVWSRDATLPNDIVNARPAAMTARQRSLAETMVSDGPCEKADAEVIDLSTLADAILADRSAGIHVLCDPSLSLTLALWLRASSMTGLAAEVVLLLEKPEDYIRSHQRRQPFVSEDRSALDWISAALAAERASCGEKRRVETLAAVGDVSSRANKSGSSLALANALYGTLSIPDHGVADMVDVLDAAQTVLEAAYAARARAEESLVQSQVAATRAYDLAEAMAKRAIASAEAPFQGALQSIQRKVLRYLARSSSLVSPRRAERFARSAAKRDPARLLEVVRSLPALDTGGSTTRITRQEALRDPEYRANDAPANINPDIRAIAFYLPQFHPFPENDKWWGKGFTEWTNVGKAIPLFEGHYQPHCPIHFGYYDLRVPQVMEEQAELARAYGIGGFAYYFYWFAGRTLMEKPLRAMLNNARVDIPFCLTWANENWTRRWDGGDNNLLIGQSHSIEDSRALIRYLEPYFSDPRYIRVDGKPVFLIYRAEIIPDMVATARMWRDEAQAMGLGGLHLVAVQSFGVSDPRPFGFDAAVEFPPHKFDTLNYASGLRLANPRFAGHIHDYRQAVAAALARPKPDYHLYRSVMLSWDNTARKPDRAHIYANFSVASYREWLSGLCQQLRSRSDLPADQRLIFINAWNEWAEGTHLEPDQRYGYAYLAATAEALQAGDHAAVLYQ